MSDAEALGDIRELGLAQGIVRYRERGQGEPIVFIHGVLCNGDLWRKVVPALATRYHCLTPDLPLGCHEPAMSRSALLTPPGLARLTSAFMEALELEDVTLVGNDTGGAIAQLVAVRHPERLSRLVLTSCDAFENFPPALLRPMCLLGHVPPAMFLAGQLLRPRALQRLLYRWSAKRPLPDEVHRSYSRAGLRDPGVVRDLAKILRSLHPRHTMEASERLAGFDKPALVVWAAEDRFFPPRHGRRLADLLPNSRFELVDAS